MTKAEYKQQLVDHMSKQLDELTVNQIKEKLMNINGHEIKPGADLRGVNLKNELHSVLASMYGVATAYISIIKRGKTWICIQQN